MLYFDFVDKITYYYLKDPSNDITIENEGVDDDLCEHVSMPKPRLVTFLQIHVMKYKWEHSINEN